MHDPLRLSQEEDENMEDENGRSRPPKAFHRLIGSYSQICNKGVIGWMLGMLKWDRMSQYDVYSPWRQTRKWMNKILRAYPRVNLSTLSKLLTSPQINRRKDDKNDSWHAKSENSIYLFSIIPPIHVFMRYHCLPFIVSIGAKILHPTPNIRFIVLGSWSWLILSSIWMGICFS